MWIPSFFSLKKASTVDNGGNFLQNISCPQTESHVMQIEALKMYRHPTTLADKVEEKNMYRHPTHADKVEEKNSEIIIFQWWFYQ